MKYNLKILIILGLIPLIINIVNITTDTSVVNIVLTGLNIVILFSLLILICCFAKDTNMKNTKFYKSFYIFILCIFIQQSISALSLPEFLEFPGTIITSILLFYSLFRMLKSRSKVKI